MSDEINNEVDDISKSEVDNIKESKDELKKDKVLKCPKCGSKSWNPDCEVCQKYAEEKNL